jgi:hypothetical protein
MARAKSTSNKSKAGRTVANARRAKPAKTPKAAKKAPKAKAKTATKAETATKRPGAKRAKPAAASAPAMTRPAPRADFGAPIDGFFEKQPPHLRAILDELRAMIEEAAPDAQSSIKWGMPVYTLDGAPGGTRRALPDGGAARARSRPSMMCALGAHTAHVNLIMAGPPDAYADPDGRLSGEGELGRHLKLTTVEELPHDAVRDWLRTAVEIARSKR